MEIIGYCTKYNCVSGVPDSFLSGEKDPSIIKYIIKDERGNICAINPPLNPSEIEMACTDPDALAPIVDIDNLKCLVAEIASRNRSIYTDGNNQTVSYLEAKFKEYLGVKAKVYRQEIEVAAYAFGDKFKEKGEAGPLYNVVARLPGKDHSKKLVITAHLDSIGEGLNDDVAPGANDNASGLAVMLEIARYTGQNELPFDIEFVAFNAEEYHLNGSRTYTNKLPDKGDSIIGVINLDMLGGNSTHDKLVVSTGKHFRYLADYLKKVNDKHSIFSLFEVKLVRGKSDDNSFRWKGIPAVKVSENVDTQPEENYPGYFYAHTSADTADKLNYDMIAKSAELCIHFLEELKSSGDWDKLKRPVFENDVEIADDADDPDPKSRATTDIFAGRIDDFGSHPVFSQYLERMSYLGGLSEKDYRFYMRTNWHTTYFGMVGPSKCCVDIYSPDDIFSKKTDRAFFSTVMHESFHAIDREETEWETLYWKGYRLGTWDLLKDSVFLNTFATATGHPKDGPNEGLASAGQAYMVFSKTFRKLIAVLALPKLPQNAFENETLNRVLALIWEQTPDRAALRQNLIDIYLYIGHTYCRAHEFENDF